MVIATTYSDVPRKYMCVCVCVRERERERERESVCVVSLISAFTILFNVKKLLLIWFFVYHVLSYYLGSIFCHRIYGLCFV